MELSEVHVLAAERNATMKDTIKISKQKLYEYVETFFDTIKADPEIYYNKLKRRLQEIGKDRFFEEMARIKTARADQEAQGGNRRRKERRGKTGIS